MPGPRQATGQEEQAAPLAAYLGDAADLIAGRVNALADTAVRRRPPWATALGQPPDDPGLAREWHRHVGVVAAYRDQHKVTTDDPRQVLGPYAEPGHAGHKAYWHAAESVHAARQFAGLDTARPDQVFSSFDIADVYGTLPARERADIASRVASKHGILWLGARNEPDEHAACQPAYTADLITIMTERGYLSSPETGEGTFSSTTQEPLEAEHARRKADRLVRSRPGQARGTQQPGSSPRLDPQRQPRYGTHDPVTNRPVPTP